MRWRSASLELCHMQMSCTLTPSRRSPSPKRSIWKVSIDFGWMPSARPTVVWSGLSSMSSTFWPNLASKELDGLCQLHSGIPGLGGARTRASGRRGRLRQRKHRIFHRQLSCRFGGVLSDRLCRHWSAALLSSLSCLMCGCGYRHSWNCLSASARRPR